MNLNYLQRKGDAVRSNVGCKKKLRKEETLDWWILIDILSILKGGELTEGSPHRPCL